MKKQINLFSLLIGIGVVSFGFSSTASAAVRGSITTTPPPTSTGNNSQTFVSPP